jgi:hypothetical protein
MKISYWLEQMSVLTQEIESVDSPSETNKKKTRNKGQSTLTVGPYVKKLKFLKP